MIVAALQMCSGDCKRDNILKASRLIEEAARRGAQVVALPEMFNFMGRDEDLVDQAESIPGPSIERLAELAATHEIYLLAGSMPEKTSSSNKVYNTSVLLDPTGELCGLYRKIHLMNADLEDGVQPSESKYITAGEAVVTVKTAVGRFGLSI